MFEQEYKLLLIDFGTVIKHPMSQSSGMIGTPRYASPEQLNEQILTPLSDQFSMGATLYYLLLNKRPFESRDPKSSNETISDRSKCSNTSRTHLIKMPRDRSF